MNSWPTTARVIVVIFWSLTTLCTAALAQPPAPEASISEPSPPASESTFGSAIVAAQTRLLRDGARDSLPVSVATPQGSGVTVSAIVVPVGSSSTSNAGRSLFHSELAFKGRSGVRVVFSVVRRIGYSLPVEVAQPMGADVPLIDQGSSFVDVVHPVVWDTTVTVRQPLKREGVAIELLGEGLNLFNDNRKPESMTLAPIVSGRTVRGGVSIRF
jgi:hypothetical protein